VGCATAPTRAALSWKLPDGDRQFRCQLHAYQLVPEEAVRHDDHIVAGEGFACRRGPAHEHRIVAEPDG
jgi:hypothetical protein